MSCRWRSVVADVVVLVAGGSDDPDSGSSTALDVIKLLIGVVFLVMALGQWRRLLGQGIAGLSN